MNKIEEYALKIVADYAESGVEDDMDEDGEFESEEVHEAACDLALAIIAGMRANPEKVLALAEEPSNG